MYSYLLNLSTSVILSKQHLHINVYSRSHTHIWMHIYVYIYVFEYICEWWDFMSIFMNKKSDIDSQYAITYNWSFHGLKMAFTPSVWCLITQWCGSVSLGGTFMDISSTHTHTCIAPQSSVLLAKSELKSALPSWHQIFNWLTLNLFLSYALNFIIIFWF